MRCLSNYYEANTVYLPSKKKLKIVANGVMVLCSMEMEEIKHQDGFGAAAVYVHSGKDRTDVWLPQDEVGCCERR